jgi:hypothetical protein
MALIVKLQTITYFSIVFLISEAPSVCVISNRIKDLSLFFCLYCLDESLDVDQLKLEWIDVGDNNVCDLRLSPDGKHVVFRSLESGGAHNKTAALMMLDVETKQVLQR